MTLANFFHFIMPMWINIPLTQVTLQIFGTLKKDNADSVTRVTDPTSSFSAETDASKYVKYYTNREWMLCCILLSHFPVVNKYLSIEKDTSIIVKALQKWHHYLTGWHFQVITYQHNAAFMFKSGSKIKKMRLLVNTLHFYAMIMISCSDLTSICCSTCSNKRLKVLHNNLCHPECLAYNSFYMLQ